jgi:glycosyltransferase involved in cell wall biosynthesis
MSRICYVTFGSIVHGAEKRIIKLALDDLHVKNGFDTPILIVNKKLLHNAQKDAELGGLIKNRMSQVITVPNPQSIYWRLYKLFFPFILLWYSIIHKINIYHVYLGAISASAPAGILGLKVIGEITSPDMADRFVQFSRKRPFLARKFFRINCVSQSVYERLMNGLSFLKEPPNNVVYISVPYSDVDGKFLKSVHNKKKLVVCASRFIERKNVMRFAEMVKPLCALNSDWKFELLGSGPLEEDLKKFLADEISKGCVKIYYSTDIKEVFSRSSIIVSLIEPDNYPSQSIFEAMALGNAVVVSNSGESYRFVEGDNGILLHKDDDSRVLERLLSDEKLLSEMQSNSRLLFKTKFSKHAYFDELFEKCYTPNSLGR